MQRSLVRRTCDSVEAGAVVEEDRDDVGETAGAGGVERGHVVQVPEVDGEPLLDQSLQAAGVVISDGLEDLLGGVLRLIVLLDRYVWELDSKSQFQILCVMSIDQKIYFYLNLFSLFSIFFSYMYIYFFVRVAGIMDQMAAKTLKNVFVITSRLLVKASIYLWWVLE